MFFSSVKEINRLISKGMSNTHYWEKLTFSKLVGKEISRKENLKNIISFEDKKVQVIFGETFILALLSSAIFLLQNRVSYFF